MTCTAAFHRYTAWTLTAEGYSMSTLRELLDQKAALEAEIASKKQESVAAVRELMNATGVTLEDLGGKPVAARRGRAPSSKRAVKYRDDEGNTWTGVGQRPRWLQKALLNGCTLEQFAVRAGAVQ